MLGATTACMPKHVHTSTVETNVLGNTEALRLASKARTQKMNQGKVLHAWQSAITPSHPAYHH